MSLKSLTLLFALLGNLCGCASGLRSPEPRDFGVLAGTWQGSFKALSPTVAGAAVSTDINLRLVFAHGKAHVFTKEKSAWDEILPGEFNVDFLGTNALIYIVHAGKIPTPSGSKWFETYLVAVTAQTSSRLLVRWVRSVNNTDTKADDPDRAFTVDGEGMLDKIPSDPGMN